MDYIERYDNTQRHAVKHRTDGSGIVTLWSETADTDTFCDALASCVQDDEHVFGCIWFSPTRHAATDLVDGLSARVPSFRYGGCSTSGEVSPDGLQEHGIVALILPRTLFRASLTVLEQVDRLGMEAIAQTALEARVRFFSDAPGTRQDSVFGLMLIDGLIYAEEAVTTAIDRGLDGIPLIGGSAGDDLAFRQTGQIADGKHYHGAAILILIESRLPFRTFTDNNFVPTEHRLVVTSSDPDRRIVHEFNAEPAAEAYARAVGIDTTALDSRSFASLALVVRIGGEYHARSIQRLNDDGSLTFFCAIDNGLVLTVARSEGMVNSTRSAIERIENEIGPLGSVFGFDCVYRRLDARHRNVTERVETLYREKGFVGFNSYGEQFRSMHINQTFTGVAIAADVHRQAVAPRGAVDTASGQAGD